MNIGIGKLILFIICLIIFINGIWILSIFTLNNNLTGLVTLATIVSGISTFIFFLGFLIEVWDDK